MIVVTGGTGLVGAHLLFALTREGKHIRAIFRNEYKIENTKKVFESYTKDYQSQFDNIEWVKADLLDIPALSNALEGANFVYHSAAMVSFEPNKYHVLRHTNIEGTANIVNICIEKKVKKLCYVSSTSTLGTTSKGEPITESTFWNPEEDNSIYGITKYGAEMEVWRGTQEGLNTVIVNPGVILGAGIWDESTGRLFKKAHRGFRFYTRGSLGLIAVEDVIEIMIRLMNSPAKNERFILVAENWSYKKFLQTLATSVGKQSPSKMAFQFTLEIIWRLDWLAHKLFGKKRQVTKHIAKSLQTKKQFSNEKIKRNLNYSFKDIEETITHLGDQYLKQV